MLPSEARSLFPITQNRAYLFSGGLAPAAKPVKAALDRWSGLWSSDPAVLYAEYEEEWDLCRKKFAELVGAEESEIALTDNTSRGSNLTVEMIGAPPGSNVVVDEYTYPSSLFPWRLGAKAETEMRFVRARENRVHLEDLAKAIDERTVAVSVSHVGWSSGFRHDLAALSSLAHEKGAYLIVDASQSAGALEIDVHRMGIDFLSCCAMKWLLGTPGVGFLFVAAKHANRFTPPQAGYAGVEDAFTWQPGMPLNFVPGARRFELGLPSLPGLAACTEGMNILLAVGSKQVEEHVLALSGYCIEGLHKRRAPTFTRPEPQFRGGVVSVPVVNGGGLVRFLRDRRVDVWANPTETILRIDPHVFNNIEDVDRFLEGFDEYVAQCGRAAILPECR